MNHDLKNVLHRIKYLGVWILVVLAVIVFMLSCVISFLPWIVAGINLPNYLIENYIDPLIKYQMEYWGK